MAKNKQIHAEVPEWRYKLFEKRAAANNLSKTEYLNKIIDLEVSLSRGLAILITNPSVESDKTLREIING